MFRSHPLFKKQEGMDAARRLLCAYLQRNTAGEQQRTDQTVLSAGVPAAVPS